MKYELRAKSKNVMNPTPAPQDARNAGINSSQLLELAFASLNDAILVINPATLSIVSCNRAANKIFGYQGEDIIGRDMEFLHVDRTHYEGFCKELFPMLDANGALQKEFMMRHRDGTVFPTEHTVTEIRDAAGNRVGVVSAVRDITERKHDGKALSESELKYRSLVELAGDAIFLADAVTGNLVDCNRKAEELVGRSKNEIVGMHQSHIHPPDRVEEYLRFYQGHVETGRDIADDVVVVHKDGRHIPVDIRCSSVEIQGRLMVQGIFRDIAERKRAELALCQSHQRLLTVLNELEAMVYIADIETHEVLFANALLKDALGEVVGETCWKSLQVGQAGPCEFCTNDKLVNKNGNPLGVYEWEFQNTKIGRWFHIRDKAIEWVDGRLVRLEIATDITERKRAEEALVNNERKYRQLIENLREGILVIDKAGLTSFVNPSMAQMLGYSIEEMLGRRLSSFMDERGKTISTQNMELRKQGISGQDDFEFLHKDGSRVYAAMETSPILDDAGNYEGSLAGVINITGRKLAEIQLKESEENVRHLSKMEAIGSLAAGIAHEFNNTLHAVMGYAALTKDIVKDNEKLTHYMDYALKACERGKDIISRLLMFSMKSPFSPFVIDAARLVHESIAILKPIMPSNIEIMANIDRNSGSILTDPTMFAQLMSNLVSNAEHAIGNRIGRLTISLAPIHVDDDYIQSMRHKITIGKLGSGKYALLTVADTGCGIAPDLIGKIFDPFISCKPVGQGTGLGLAVVGGLVLRVDGAIAIESELGEGSTFYLYFPVTQVSKAQEPAVSAGQKEVASKRKTKLTGC